MFKFIYTKTLDNADEIEAESWEYTNKKDAIALFNERVKKLVDEVLSNSFLNSNISIYKNKAVFKIENVHHCLAVTSDKEMIFKRN